MGADIYLNDHKLGTAQDQFLRYKYPLVSSEVLTRDDRSSGLVVSFDPNITVAGRFMACTGGWDWAPYSDMPLTDDTHATTHSRGIWKSVYLVRVASMAITAVVPEIYYRGAYPVEALVDGHHAGFKVDVRVHWWSAREAFGYLKVKGSWGSFVSEEITLLAGESNVTISLAAEADAVKLWWPVGMGPDLAELSKRMLYDVKVTFIEPSIDIQVHTSRTIGFRHFALVTGNDSEAAYVRDSIDKEGTQSHGMFFRVNGVPVYSRGANVIPMEEFEGQLDAEAHIRLVKSAVEGNMNTLRVWGGGIFLPQAFYEACDQYGVLIYQDMMYAQEGHAPSESNIQGAEIRHNIRTLSSHPSIVIWDGCNECQVVMESPTEIYAKFVLTVVAEEDASRAVWPSSPAYGWMSGVERLTARPANSALTTLSSGPTIEIHGAYVHGTGFPAVNGGDFLVPINPNIPIDIDPNPSMMGISSRNVFASEFGCVTMSSFESMSATLHPRHWGLHGGEIPDNCSGMFIYICEGDNSMAQRNYPCDSIIQAHFETKPGYFEGVGEAWFQRQLYHCMIGQALIMKGVIETRRSKNELGHLIWQLNEIWPTGGWGSLEYGNARYPGQVLGGRWKPLHYWLRSSIFADVIATCGSMICYVRNDASRPFQGSVSIKSINIGTGNTDWGTLVRDIDLQPGPGSLKTFTIPGNDPELDGSTHILLVEVSSDDGHVVSHSTLLRKPPKNITNLPSDSGLEVSVGNPTPGKFVPIRVSARVPVALFVVLTTKANGRFSDNAFSLLNRSATIDFIPFDTLDMDILRRTLRVEDLAMYVEPPRNNITSSFMIKASLQDEMRA